MKIFDLFFVRVVKEKRSLPFSLLFRRRIQEIALTLSDTGRSSSLFYFINTNANRMYDWERTIFLTLYLVLRLVVQCKECKWKSESFSGASIFLCVVIILSSSVKKIVERLFDNIAPGNLNLLSAISLSIQHFGLLILYFIGNVFASDSDLVPLLIILFVLSDRDNISKLEATSMILCNISLSIVLLVTKSDGWISNFLCIIFITAIWHWTTVKKICSFLTLTKVSPVITASKKRIPETVIRVIPEIQIISVGPEINDSPIFIQKTPAIMVDDDDSSSPIDADGDVSDEDPSTLNQIGPDKSSSSAAASPANPISEKDALDGRGSISEAREQPRKISLYSGEIRRPSLIIEDKEIIQPGSFSRRSSTKDRVVMIDSIPERETASTIISDINQGSKGQKLIEQLLALVTDDTMKKILLKLSDIVGSFDVDHEAFGSRQAKRVLNMDMDKELKVILISTLTYLMNVFLELHGIRVYKEYGAK